MLHKEFWGMLFLAFIAWVFISGTPQERINKFCRPVGWGGNAVTSLSALAIPSQQENVKRWFDKFEYGCEYMTWRLFYQDDYVAYMRTQQQGGASAVKDPSKPVVGPKPAVDPTAVPAGSPLPTVAP
jgi:hypothetical protein